MKLCIYLFSFGFYAIQSAVFAGSLFWNDCFLNFYFSFSASLSLFIYFHSYSRMRLIFRKIWRCYCFQYLLRLFQDYTKYTILIFIKYVWFVHLFFWFDSFVRGSLLFRFSFMLVECTHCAVYFFQYDSCTWNLLCK